MVDRQTGNSRQIGFVRFANQEDATAAMADVNGVRLLPNSPPLVVRYAESQSQRLVRKAKKLPSGSSAASSPTAIPTNIGATGNPVHSPAGGAASSPIARTASTGNSSRVC
jgi:RNA recognition motif-containing protein